MNMLPRGHRHAAGGDIRFTGKAPVRHLCSTVPSIRSLADMHDLPASACGSCEQRSRAGFSPAAGGGYGRISRTAFFAAQVRNLCARATSPRGTCGGAPLSIRIREVPARDLSLYGSQAFKRKNVVWEILPVGHFPRDKLNPTRLGAHTLLSLCVLHRNSCFEAKPSITMRRRDNKWS